MEYPKLKKGDVIVSKNETGVNRGRTVIRIEDKGTRVICWAFDKNGNKVEMVYDISEVEKID